jgi:3-hydroxymyristoyl/3-hydroxydecanoyl-(acyl carrier protein) dehydratase
MDSTKDLSKVPVKLKERLGKFKGNPTLPGCQGITATATFGIYNNSISKIKSAHDDL